MILMRGIPGATDRPENLSIVRMPAISDAIFRNFANDIGGVSASRLSISSDNVCHACRSRSVRLFPG